MSVENLAIAHRWFEEVWNQRRPETVHELTNSDSVCHTEDGPMRGPDEFLQRQYHPFTAAFPDLRVVVDGQLASEDQVVVRWTATGTHAGDGLGCQATHQTVTMTGISWFVIRDGKLVEGWQSSNINPIVRELVLAAVSPT